ncbi:MAG: DUF5009 domain-containing protein, partial [Acidobacteria bacterium]|nr:DUF5009 domain-containing protein [Acidobacteriota bacterium]
TWSLVFPLNKSLWTSSYVLYTSGLALLTLAACYWLLDSSEDRLQPILRRVAKPFVIFGVNALALFVFSGIFGRLLGLIRLTNPTDAQTTSLQQYIFTHVFLRFASPINASLAYAICFILLWLFLMWLLYRKQSYLKV